MKKHRLEDCTSTKTLLDRESEQATEEVEETEEYQEWKKSSEFLQYVRRAQQIAGEVLWLSTSTRPDLCYPIQRMTSAATKDPKKALIIGTRILRYLKRYERIWDLVYNQGRSRTQIRRVQRRLAKRSNR